MSQIPDEQTIDAWARLVRAQQLLLERVEKELLPPLRWYDVLIELHRAPRGLRQFEIGEAVLLNKYNVSRLFDRLQREELIVRYACESDARGAQVQITTEGSRLLKRMWHHYAKAITEHFGRHLSSVEIGRLSALPCRFPGVCR